MDGKAISLFIASILLAQLARSEDQLPGVTVQAERQREQLRHEVDAFVSSAITIPPGAADAVVARWAVEPVCPLVAGLSREAGEFILSRISRITKDAGAPLASEHCKSPNLFVVFASDSAGFVQKLKAKRGALSYEASKSQIAKFEIPRPVRVWYNEGTVNLDGTILARMLNTNDAVRGKPFGENLANVLPSQYGSRLNASTITHDVLVVVEVVDKKMVASFSIGQLADYIAMAGLTQFDPDKDFGAAPTILNLFNTGKESRPQGITAWDSALLQALYKVDRSKKLAIADIQGRVLTSVSRTTSKDQ